VFNVAMCIRTDSSADYVTKHIMRHLSYYTRETASELSVIEDLTDYLLDSRNTRATAVEGLARWAFYDDYPQVVNNLLPQLDPAERTRVLDERREGSA
jgi:hypothetical protein